jgi:hypothetical protein
MAKHRQYGMNVQIVADLPGRVLGVSRGFPGSWHGMHCSTDAGLTTLAGAAGTAIGDSGYQGSDMTTPNKKQPGQHRTESDLGHNTAIAVIRVAVNGPTRTSKTGESSPPATATASPDSTEPSPPSRDSPCSTNNTPNLTSHSQDSTK